MSESYKNIKARSDDLEKYICENYGSIEKFVKVMGVGDAETDCILIKRMFERLAGFVREGNLGLAEEYLDKIGFKTGAHT